jgi:hypothetical protein
MATIIDFAQMRELLGPRAERSHSADGSPPEGKVILFTGVRYERCDSVFEGRGGEQETQDQGKPRRKKKS